MTAQVIRLSDYRPVVGPLAHLTEGERCQMYRTVFPRNISDLTGKELEALVAATEWPARA